MRLQHRLDGPACLHTEEHKGMSTAQQPDLPVAVRELLEAAANDCCTRSKPLSTRLGRSAHTVDNQFKAAIQSMDVGNRAEAVLRAVAEGVIKPGWLSRRRDESSRPE